MINHQECFSLGKAKAKVLDPPNSVHISSKIQADTLFTFMTHLEFLITSVKQSMLSPRYCEEDVSYLNINDIKKLAFPMKCFCDINMHKLDEHLDWYGFYGLAFPKEWGMKNKIQPVQYINPDSYLCEDFSEAFSAALKVKSLEGDSAQSKMKNFLLHEIFYYKPYSGKIENRNTKQIEEKCFTDECEWRFVPNVTSKDYYQVIYNDNVLNSGTLIDLSNSMLGIPEISLKFNYSDLKYIIVKSVADFEKLTKEIINLNLDQIVEHELISKIIIWDKSRGDF